MKRHPIKTSDARDLRCKGCRILLGKVDESGLTIVRGELQITVTGEFHASIVCYRPRCRTLNVLHMRTGTAASGAAM